MSRSPLFSWVLVLSLSFGFQSKSPAQDFQGSSHLMPFDEDTIAYSKTADTGPIARLQQRLNSGEAHLTRDGSFGYLRSLLKELGVSTNSQMLVFSKTSFQRERISPQTPRSLFFNDDVYVGYVQGSPLLEISVADPKLGGVFYTLAQNKNESPRFVRTDQCLECHASAKSMGVPGHLVRSFSTDENGVVDLATGTSLVNHRTPLAERWGGWYVTGLHGTQIHRGNLIGEAAIERHRKQPDFGGNETNLAKYFDVSQYLLPTSDIVALMVLEHQTHMHNFITRMNYEATIALKQYGHLNYLKSITEAFLKYLLFTEETPLAAPIRGSGGFVGDFRAKAIRDSKGRSLRDFDLQTRLFKYPCSYLIYSEAFNGLPAPLKEKIYARLQQILEGRDESTEFDSLSIVKRRAIYEILAETKSDLPASWKQSASNR